MLNLQDIRKNILERIRPTQSEINKGRDVFARVQQAIQQKATEKGIEVAFVELEGSAGIKQTQLRGRRELDIFIGLPPYVFFSDRMKSPSKSELRQFFRKLVKEVALEAIKEIGGLSPSIAYAEHPYVMTSVEDHNLDIVFCFDLTPEYLAEKGPITAVDRTPHHSRFVDSHLSSIQRDEVRMLKAFLISNFVYGDSSPVGRSGFTGFSTEMLVYHTGNFAQALEFLRPSKLKPLDYFNRTHSDLSDLFRHDQLIVIDPTDPNRNIASSISERAYRYTVVNAAKLLAKPQAAFFSMKPIPVLSRRDRMALHKNSR
jgi:tRNA nucleotidyltransferase (CCA-adding enzyme)